MTVQPRTASPRWAVALAHVVPLLTLPSALWRLPLALGFSNGLLEHGVPATMHRWEAVSVLILSALCEGAALLSLGLVRPWGERVPAWFPRLAGRRIAPRLVIVPFVLGTLALALIWGYAFRDGAELGEVTYAAEGWRVLLVACYAPLVLWAPANAVLVIAYARRRHRIG
jgi:hypothetical protein